LPRWLALAALEAVLGIEGASFAASYLDQEKGQAEALTVWQRKQLDLDLPLLSACQLATRKRPKRGLK